MADVCFSSCCCHCCCCSCAVAMHDYDVITRRVVFRNMDTRLRRPGSSITGAASRAEIGNSKVIQKASSMTIDLEGECEAYYMTQLSGR